MQNIFRMTCDGKARFVGEAEEFKQNQERLNILNQCTVDGHRPVIVKRVVIGSKGGWAQRVSGISAQYLSCKVFRVWSMINIRESIIFY